MLSDLEYINIAKKYGCSLIYSPKYYGYLIYYKGYSEVLFNLEKRTLAKFESYCKDFTTRHNKGIKR